MIEIKFNRKKKKKGLKPKMETSKKLAWFSGICFALSVLYSIVIFTIGVCTNTACDFTLPITLVSVTGAAFGVVMVMYSNKSRYENVIKIQQGFLREKLTILKELGVLNNNRAVQEVEDVLTDIETDCNNEKSMANQEITYNG